MKKKQRNSFTQGLIAVFASRRAKFFAITLLACLPLLTIGVMKLRVSALPCPCTILPANPTPQGTDNNPGPLEVGFKFKSSLDGYITGVRFYKMAGMTGTHTGSLWDRQGNRIATATFGGETGSGWQEVTFSGPVAITANTVYTASVFMQNGVYAYTTNYFTSPVVSSPLTAPAHNTADAADAFDNRGQGVFDASGSSVYPTGSVNQANYWVDVSFTGAPDTDPPVVSATVPASGASSVNLGETISATFDIPMLPASISSSTFSLKDDQDNPVAGTISYSTTTKTASFTPSSALTPGETYTATLEGGAGTVARSLDDIALASDYTWSFTATTTDPCPCSLKNNINPAGSTTFDGSGSRELGVKIVPQANGYITALRFYKPIISTETSHTGTIWNSTGTSLATVTFSNESDYGWQEARLVTPLQVTKGQVYVVSYGTTTAVYQGSAGYLGSNISVNSLTAYATGASQNATSGSGNANGVFGTTIGAYPTTAASGDYYWIDAVFSTNSGATESLQPLVTQPKNNAIGVLRNKPITANFSRALNAATISNSTVRLFDSSNTLVSGTASYNVNDYQIKLTPSANLAYGQKYTVRLSASIAAADGVTLGSEYSWSFTVGSQLGSDPKQGWANSPVLVVTSSSNNYSQYYAEILRTEGLNHFEVKDLSAVNASMLSLYDAVLLADMTLSQPQVDMFSSWVTAGGNLIAMRPDKKLTTLLGLNDANSTRSSQYLKADTSTGPGQGIVNESIQFKGIGDNYTLNGASAVASFYSDASTATSNPAATTRSVGSNGGTAMAFTYDLARSVIGLHQGNQSWAGDERDGIAAKRANDLFYGAKTGDVQPDWVDLNKIHIPQADEQQRLLANMLTMAVKDKKPLPRFWYLPNNQKAALVLAGDDHGLTNDGTERTINNWLNESTKNCSIADWECIRASHYTYTTGALTNARAGQYVSHSFELGNHPSNSGGCNDYTSYAQLGGFYTTQFAAWRAKYSSVPNQKSNRFHCYVWSDWDSQIRVDADNGIRYDLNYVAYPSAWVNGRSPLMTGSGMNMRFTDATGNLMDVYQGVTSLDDTAANATAIAALLDNAIGSTGYYGIFGTHYDMSDSYERTLFDAAKSRNIPMISSEQALTWLDGRNSSNFSSVSGSNGQFNFTLNAAEGSTGLKAMMPMHDAGGILASLKLSSADVTYQTQTVKGIQYAVFDGVPGNYTATYSDYDPNPDTGGGDSGEEGDSTSTPSTGTSSTPGSSSKKHTTTALSSPGADETPQMDTTPGEEVTSQPSATDQDSEKREKDLIENQNSDGSQGFPWVLVSSLVVLLAGLGLWWFIATRRRRKKEQMWQ